MGLWCCPEIAELTGKWQKRKISAETDVLSEMSLMERLSAGGCGGDRGEPGITQGPIAAVWASPAECNYSGMSPGMTPDAAGVWGAQAKVSIGTPVLWPSHSELS